MFTNTAAWLDTVQSPLRVGPAPYTSPRENEIVVQNRAVAVNPLDWVVQLVGNLAFPWLRYPFILGADLAGDVVEVGACVTRFKVGDRVLAQAVGTDRARNRAAEGSFQDYTVVLAHLASPIPDHLPYEDAAVLPLGLSTAACGLFQQDHLALVHPSKDPSPTGQTLLVWGGSTSVGSNAIQLAVAAGYEVVTTAGRHNFDYVRGLGAGQVFDRRSPTVVADLTLALRGHTVAGALAVGNGSAEPCVAVIAACQGRKFVSTASQAVSFGRLPLRPGFRPELPGLLVRVVASSIALQVRARRAGVRTGAIFGSTLMHNEVSHAVYEDFLPAALAEGRYAALPRPEVVGHGLAALQAAMDAQKQGLSARKLVVSL